MAIYGLIALEKTGRIRAPSLLDFVVAASYSVYLTHLVTGSTLRSLLDRFHVATTAFGLSLFVPLGAIAFGCLVYILIERPLIAPLRPLAA